MLRLVRLAALLVAVGVLWVGTAPADPPAKKKSYPDWVRPRLVGAASDAGGFVLDEAKVRATYPNFDWTADQLGYLQDVLKLGDSRAAIVARIEPLVVSCYSDELDAVILVRFPDRLTTEYKLMVDDPLVASWVYPRRSEPPHDVVQGEGNLQRHKNGAPQVALFLSNSVEKMDQRVAAISEQEWARTRALTIPALKRAHGKYRSSFPLDTANPPELFDALPAAN